MCGLRWRSALLIPCLLGCFTLQNHHIFFLLPYPVREENTPIWPWLASLRYKYKIECELIFHLLSYPGCWQRLSSSQPSPAALRNAYLVWILLRMSPVVEGIEKSDVLSADCMVCFWAGWHLSVECCAEIPEEKKDFHRAGLGALKNINTYLGQRVFSCLLWYGALPFSETVILLFCIIHSECTQKQIILLSVKG